MVFIKMLILNSVKVNTSVFFFFLPLLLLAPLKLALNHIIFVIFTINIVAARRGGAFTSRHLRLTWNSPALLWSLHTRCCVYGCVLFCSHNIWHRLLIMEIVPLVRRRYHEHIGVVSDRTAGIPYRLKEN